ncbi:MAG: hypothetical protein IPG53_23805 [Ignavibacteriales bacterium]|nr:hypothetical protein [Ignavibacteriales bacterium]
MFLSDEIRGNGIFINLVPKEEGVTGYGYFLTISGNRLTAVKLGYFSCTYDIEFFLLESE